MTRITIGLAANAAGAHTQELLDGFAMARDWTGLDCDYFWAEDGRDPVQARQAAQTMVQAKVPMVIGHLSAAASLTAAQIYCANDMAFIATATSHPDLNPTNWPGILRVCGTDDRTAAAMISIAPTRGIQLVLYQQQVYGISLGKSLQKQLMACGRRVQAIEIAPNAPLPEIAPDTGAIFIAGIHEFCADVTKQLASQTPTTPCFLGDDCLTPNFLALGAFSVEGCIVTCPVVPQKTPALDGYLPASAIGISIGLQALDQAPDRRGAALGQYIKSRAWPTPFGDFSFDGDGNITGLVDQSFTIRDNAFQTYAPQTSLEYA